MGGLRQEGDWAHALEDVLEQDVSRVDKERVLDKQLREHSLVI